MLNVFLQLPGLFIVQCAVKAQVLEESASTACTKHTGAVMK